MKYYQGAGSNRFFLFQYSPDIALTVKDADHSNGFVVN